MTLDEGNIGLWNYEKNDLLSINVVFTPNNLRMLNHLKAFVPHTIYHSPKT